jgi:hypothetical protein
MGITIHYTGAFNQGSNLAEMITEIEEMAKANHWKYFIYEKEFPSGLKQFPWGDKEIFHPENIYGISITPPNCETADFCFLSNGIASNPFALKFWSTSKVETEKEMTWYCFTKTQFAGYEVHQKLVDLFRYITAKYYANFEMTDEAGYWENSNKSDLMERFAGSTRILDFVEDRLNGMDFKEGESLEEFTKRLGGTFYNDDGTVKE